MSGNFRYILLMIIVAFVGGAVPSFGKIALTELSVASFTFIRFFTALIVLLPFYLKVRTSIRGDVYKLLGLSLLAVANVIIFAFGIQHTQASMAQAIYTMSPILATVLSFYVLREVFSKKKVAGVLIGFVGAFLLIAAPVLQGLGAAAQMTKGNVLILVAMISVTLFTVLSKKLQDKYHPVEITFFFCLTAVILTAPFFLVDLRSGALDLLSVGSLALTGVFYVGIFGTAVYYLLTQYVIKGAGPVLASMVLYVQPFAAILWAGALLSEKVGIIFFLGLTLSLMGVWLTMNSKAASS